MRLLAAVVIAAATAAVASAGTRSVTYYVAAAKGVLTGGGAYSHVDPAFDRAAKNNYPNRSRFLGEAYLGDGGATVTYRLKRLSATPRRFALWVNFSDDALHPSGTRAVVISIPKLHWSRTFSPKSQNTEGWKAQRAGFVRTKGGVVITFRKVATTEAAFVMNAFALTTSARPPSFAPR